MKLKVNLIMIFCALLICQITNAPKMFAQESNGLPKPTPPSPVTVAPTPTQTPEIKKNLPAVAVPVELQNNKFVQLLLISLEYQTDRANNEQLRRIEKEGQLAEMTVSRNEWKGLFFDERKATTELQISLTEARNESANLRVANAGFLRQRELDKQFISDQNSEINRLRRSRWKYAAAGFAAGFAAGVPTGSFIAVKFNF